MSRALRRRSPWRDVREAWACANPLGWGGRWQGWEEHTTRTYRAAYHVLRRVRPLVERPGLVVRAWRGESTEVGGWRLVGYRLKASVLVLCWRIRWYYPDWNVPAVQVTSWDLSSFSGGEQTCYEWTEMHVGYGRHLGVWVCTENAP